MSCVDLLPTILAFPTSTQATSEEPSTRKKYYQHTNVPSCFSTKKNGDLKIEEFGELQKFVKNRKTDWYMPNAKQDKKLHRRFIKDEKRSEKGSDTVPQKQFRNMLKPEATEIASAIYRDQGTHFI